MKTIGQAVDEAISRHESRYPGSKAYQVLASKFDGDWNVYVSADHFSYPLLYVVEGMVPRNVSGGTEEYAEKCGWCLSTDCVQGGCQETE